MRTIELTTKGFDAIGVMNQSHGKDLLLWLAKYSGAPDTPVDQSKFLLDLNKAQETALSKPTSIPLSNLFNSMKTGWIKNGIVKVVNLATPKPVKLSKVNEMQAYIERLEGLLLENNISFMKQVWQDNPKNGTGEPATVEPTPLEKAIDEQSKAA
jgi:hypothetical protein